MSVINIQDLSFTYPGNLTPVFEHVNLDLDTDWRLGLIGRNGKGKTTFLKLLLGEIKGSGTVHSLVQFDYFPKPVSDESLTALAVARKSIAPFDAWEKQMQTWMAQGTEEAIDQYGEIEQQYAAADGYTIDQSIVAEAGKLGILQPTLQRPYSSLSGGEKVKLLLAALFLKKHSFLLIDEPTDHLDAEGRRTVAKWLSGKSGFILVSHDRLFIDEAVDHILAINRSDIELQKGNYSSWRQNRTRQDDFEKAENQKLETSIARLQQAAKRTERWGDQIEKSKKGSGSATYEKGPASVDRGYIGHQAARMMQRRKSIDQRREREITQKQGLLKNVEESPPLKLLSLKSNRHRLVSVEEASFGYGDKMLFENISFTIEEGDRIAVQGPNGSGKTSLLKLITGDLQPTTGTVRVNSGLVISTLPQETEFLSGSLRDFSAAQQLDDNLFLTLLRKMDFEREAFSQKMESYSKGQKKKVCLAASLAKPAHLFVWDEPLNYIDVLSREQIEQAVLESQAAVLFVEHDGVFVEKVSTKELLIGKGQE